MKALTIAATLENISAVTAFIERQLEALDCPMKARMQIDMAIDELFGNIAHYAYASDTGDVTVRFAFDKTTRTASIAFIDGGVAFDPLAQPEPDVTLSAEERKIGGLGIFMVKKTMDAVSYRREGNRNILTIQKGI